MAGQTEFFNAVKLGDVQIVRKLIEADASLVHARDEGATGLHYAALNNHKEIVDLLLSAGADIDAEDEQFLATPIGWANERGNLQMVHYLRQCGAELSIHRAAACGLLGELKEMLLLNAPDLNVLGGYGTPLHEASLWGHPHIVKLLLESGADPSMVNVEGKTALEVARHQVESEAGDTPLVGPERRSEIVSGCRQVIEILQYSRTA